MCFIRSVLLCRCIWSNRFSVRSRISLKEALIKVSSRCAHFSHLILETQFIFGSYRKKEKDKKWGIGKSEMIRKYLRYHKCAFITSHSTWEIPWMLTEFKTCRRRLMRTPRSIVNITLWHCIEIRCKINKIINSDKRN